MVHDSDSGVRWRPGVGFAAAVVLALVALIAVVVVDQRLERRGDQKLADLRQEQQDGAATIKRLTTRLDAELLTSRAVAKRTRAVEKRLGPVLRSYRAADAQRTTLTASVDSMRSELEDWVEVPDIGLENETIAQSTIEADGLTWSPETVEGSCTDYEDHFVDGGYGWSDVVKQEPAPGSKMPPGRSVTIYTWDFFSDWELGCTTDDEGDL